ncbi:MAG TPA: hypothetical protein DIT13_15625 [Verrucomicrobiales bacterium]|nr:hypothetical protein [Verrucomicrobiales bacterium]HRJ07726.1 immunoglobulin domain-containing protein [Prosthecobacter sp.]HRK13628.1 immunoglobulin domain-containing protein [Prosthecobacter sp.]
MKRIQPFSRTLAARLLTLFLWTVLIGGAAAQSFRRDGSWLSNANGTLANPAAFYRTIGSTATATAARGTGGTAQVVVSITVTNAGSGYVTPPLVTITGGAGSGATATANLNASGSVASITVNTGGSGYTANPTVTIAPPPSPGGVGSTVTFNTDITANRILTLDANRTYGRMILGDLSSTQVYTFNSGAGGGFIFDNGSFSGGNAYFNKFQGGADVINTSVTLQSDLVARIISNRVTLSGTISGPGSLTSVGNGTLALTGNNTGNNVNLWLWNRNGTGTGAQVELGAATGNATGGDIIIGNTTRGTNGHAVLQLLQGRTNLDQISDSASLIFDSISGVGRNAYFKLMGGNETVGRILDVGDRAVIENREGEAVGTAAVLTIAGSLTSRVNGFLRDNTGNNLQQADSNGAVSGGARLGITKQGTGNLTLAGGNIIYTGDTLVSGGSLTLFNTTNFRSNITNNSQLNFDVTGTVNMRKSFPAIPGSNPTKDYPDQYLSISGSGSVNKTGAGTLGIFGTQNIGGSLTMNNGTLNLNASAAGISIGGDLISVGDAALNRNINLRGNVSIGGDLEFSGRFNNTGSTMNISGAVLGLGDQELGTWVDTAVNVAGSIHIKQANLVLESDFSIGKTSTGTTSNSNIVTITESSNMVVGMRVTGGGVPGGTTVTAIDAVNRRVTLSNNASISNATALTFSFSNNTDGRITGTPADITISGRSLAIHAGASGSALILSNTNLSNNTNRLPDSTPIISNGGVFEFINDASAASFSETAGTLVLNGGSLQVIGYRAANGRTSTLTFAGLQRNPGGVVDFEAKQLVGGVTTVENNTLGTDTRNRIMFTAAPALANGIIGGWAYSNNEWVKYGANGVTQLLAADYNNSNQDVGWIAANNVKMSVAQTLTARRTINSLNIQPDLEAAAQNRALTLNQQRLDIVTGGLLSNHGDHTINSQALGFVTAGTEALGDRELITIVGTTGNAAAARTLTFNAAIRDYTISRNVTVTNNSTTVNIVGAGQTTTGLAVGMAFIGAGIPDGTVITVINTSTQFVVSQPISPGFTNQARDFGDPRSLSLVKAGPGFLRLNNLGNTYSGPTVVSNGTLMVGGIGALGTIPSVLREDHFRVEGGSAIVFGRRTDITHPNPAPDNVFDFTDGNRGFSIGPAGGRFEVGFANPNNAPTTGAGEPIVHVNITNPLHAEGPLELAVRANANNGQSNSITIGTPGGSNSFLSGIKTEGSFEGVINIHGNNTIGGLLMEGSTFNLTGDNDFTENIRVLGGTLNITGANTFKGGQDFPSVTMGSGILRLLNPAALGTNGIKVALGNNGQVQLEGINHRFTQLSGNALSRVVNASASSATLTLDLEQNQTFAGQFDNGGGGGLLNLTKSGPGRLTLTGTQSGFSGVVRINDGAIDVRNMPFSGVVSSLGTGGNGAASRLILNGGALSFSPTVQQRTDRSFTLGAGPNGGTLVANGANRAASVTMGVNFILFDELVASDTIGFEGNGARLLTLSGVNTGLNTLALQLGDKSAMEPTGLQKIGSGWWLLGKAADYSGQTSVLEGVLRLESNYAAGTSSVATTASFAADTFTGNLLNGTELTFPQFNQTTLPGGITGGQRYYVVEANSVAGTFKVSTTPGGQAVNLLSDGANVTYVPNISSVAATTANPDTDRFTGNLPNGTPVMFGTRLVFGATAIDPPLLPVGISENITYFVVNAASGVSGPNFQVSTTPGGAPVNFTTTGNHVYYSASPAGNTSEGIYVMGGRLDLGNVDYTAPETIIFNGGGLGVPIRAQAAWAGNVDTQANSSWTIGLDASLTLTGNILGNRTITQLGEGTVVLKGERLNPTVATANPAVRTDVMDHSRSSYTLQAGTLVLDYSSNNNSKLTDNSTFVMGGGRRGGILRLVGGTHEEIVSTLSLQAGASRVFRDSGASVVRFNTISRQTGSSIYFDGPGLAKVDMPNINGILGGWAVVRDARVQAFLVIPGTVSRTFSVDETTGMLKVPDVEPVHYLAAGVPVRFTTTGQLPDGLAADTTYYVTEATSRSFRVSATPFGPAVQTVTFGTGTHTVETFGAVKRPGPASLIFQADPNPNPAETSPTGFSGSKGNGTIRVRIAHNGGSNGAISVGRGGSGTVESPWRITITTTAANNSADAVVAALAGNANALGIVKVFSSAPDASADTNVYYAAPGELLAHGVDDNGGQTYSWARNATATATSFNDGPVDGFLDYSTDWGLNFNTDVLGGGAPIPVNDGASTYTLRFATGLPATLDLLAGASGQLLQTGAVLVSPTVGANDSIISGGGTLMAGNEGALQNFVFHQYNDLGDLVVNVPLTQRQSFNRTGRLAAPSVAASTQNRIITGLIGVSDNSDTSQLTVGMTVTGTGMPGGTTIAQIVDNRTVIVSADITTGDNSRNVYTFGGSIQMRGSIRQFAQNRITGVVDAQGNLATHDLYIGMPISGPGIPANYRVQTIVNESDITIGTLNGNGITVDTANHVYTGIVSQLTFTPSVGVEKLGDGTLVLNADSNYSGITFIGNGTLRAQQLTDGGVPGSLGASTNAAANLTFNGGTLQYVGMTSSSNRNFTLSELAEINIGHERTTSVFTGNISGADIFAKSGPGTLEMRGNAGLAEIRLLEGRLVVQGVDTNLAPNAFAQNNFGQTGIGELRLAGGSLELRGAREGNMTLTLGGQMYVDAGASEVRAVGVSGFNPNSLISGAISRTTQISLMGAEEITSVLRNVGGTVLFVEEPQVGGSVANILLNIPETDRARVMPWAVYQDATNIAQPGVNNFATVALSNGAVISADAASLYDLGSFFMNADNWGTQEGSATIDASEGGRIEISLDNGVESTAGSNVLVVTDLLQVEFGNLIPDMSVFGPGIPSNTQVVSLLTNPLRVVLSKNATSSNFNATYTFIRDRAYFGTLTADRALNTLRYFTPVDSTITVPAGRTLQLLSGAILAAANVRGGEKAIVGGGNISGAAGAVDGGDLVIHNHNPVAAFTIGANVVDNVLSMVNSGTTSAGSNILIVSPLGKTALVRLKPGMIISGPGIPDGTTVLSTDLNFDLVYMSANAVSAQSNKTYTFLDVTSFVQSGTGTTILSGVNTYTGRTFVHGGVLRLNSANAMPGGIGNTGGTGGIVVKGGVIGLGHGDFTRDIGTGAGQIDFQGAGGFAAYGSDRTVNIGGQAVPEALRFGNNGFVPDGSSFVLGAHDATHKTIVLNTLDLGSFSQAVRVNDGPAEVEGELAGGFAGLGRLIKFGDGTLRLSGSSSHSGGIEIAAGRLIAADVEDVFGVGTGTGTTVRMGVNSTNTRKDAALELVVEGGTIEKNLRVGLVNSRGADWLERGSVEESGDLVGTHASTAVVNGHPAIAYYDSTNGDLKYVRAADPRGTSWLPPVTVASRGDVGQFPSLAVVNGNPAISYYDATNKLLMFVRSTDISGVFWGGQVIVDSAPINAIGVQSDGKAVIGGTFAELDGVEKTRLARVNTDGSLDNTFAATANGEVLGIVIQSDDKILVVGSFTEINDVARNRIARLNADGSLDTGFNPNANGVVRGLLIEPDGRIVVWGSFTSIVSTGRNRVARLNSNGTIDTGFNPNANGEVRSVARQADGNLILGGAFTTIGGTTRNRIARVTTAGALDAGYNPNYNNTVSCILILPNGKALTGGVFTTIDGAGRRRERLARLNTDGTLDQSFSVIANAEVRDLVLQADGKVLAVGAFTTFGDHARRSLARLHSEGSPESLVDPVDSAFNVDANEEVRAVVQIASGKLLAGGEFSNIGGSTCHFLARLELADGGADAAFDRQTVDRGCYTSLAVVRQQANNGLEAPAIAYYDTLGTRLRYSRALDANGASWAVSLVLDSSANVGAGTSLKMVNIGGDLITKNTTQNTVTITGEAANGTPAVAYYDVTNGNLKYVLANNPAGSDWSAPVVVESANDVGSHLSLNVVDGFPAIAYYDATAKSLRYVRATNAGGVTNNLRDAQGNILTRAINALVFDPAWGAPGVVDSGGDVGMYPSLEIITDGTSAQGRPAIAYYDAAPGTKNLKYVRALNVTGSFPWGTPQTVASEGDVGMSAGLVLTDGVPGVAYHDATEGDVKFLHLADSTGYSRIVLGDGTLWQGGMNLQGRAFFDVEAAALATISGLVQGDAGITLSAQGTLLLTNAGNNFGDSLPGPGPDVNSAVIVRAGTLAVGANGAIGQGTVEMGDATPQIMTVERATTFASLAALKGRFDADHNGIFDNAGGPGAFVEVDITIDGRTYTEDDQGTLILVKDERENPQWNGVYQIIFNGDLQPDGTMNLARVAQMDSVAELAYGTQVRVLNGTHAGQAFFIASKVLELNVSAVQWIRDYADSNAALLASTGGLTISNSIDVNAGNGSGLAVLGGMADFTSGNSTFSGAVLLQNRLPGVRETKTVGLQSFTNTGYGITFSGLFSESNGGNGASQDSMSLSKSGAGTASLTNANTFFGGVTVQQGTLLVLNTTGSATGSGAVAVNAGAVLGGTGFIGGAVTLTGSVGNKAILRPGDPTMVSAVETLTINAPLTVGPESVVEFAIGAANITRLVANSVTVTGTGQFLVQLLDGFIPAVDTVFDLVDGTINLPGGANARDHLVLPGHVSWDTSQFLSQGTIRSTGLTTPVQINTHPVITVPAGGSPVNPGGSVVVTFSATVTGTPEFGFQWQKSPVGLNQFVNVGAAVFTTSTTATFTLTGILESDEADYRLVASNGSGTFSATSNAVTLIVNDPPTITDEPDSIVVNPGQTATFTVAATGPGPITYQWQRNFVNLTSPSATTDTLEIANAQDANEGNYRVLVSNGASVVTGPTISATATLTVRDPVVITSFPAATEASNGDPVNLTAGHTGTGTPDMPNPGDPAFTYLWERNEGSGFTPIAGAPNSGQLTLPPVTLADNGHQIRVTVSNSFSMDTRTTTLTVTEGTPSFLAQPESRTVIAGTSVTLQITPGGSSAGRAFQWRRGKTALKNGGGITGVDTPTLEFSAIDLKQAGDYSCEIKNNFGTRQSATAFVTVVAAPGTVIPVQTGKDFTLTLAFAAAKGVTPQFKWQRDGADLPVDDRISPDNLPKLVVKKSDTGAVTDSGIYTCLVTAPGPAPALNEEVAGGQFDVRVFSDKPVLALEEFPAAMVGAEFEYQIKVDNDPAKAPVSYAAKPLPSGLKLDTKTGRITGWPKVAVENLPVVITVTNSFSKPPVSDTKLLTIRPVPERAVGVFAGWLPRHQELNEFMGGRFDMTVTAAGAFSGRVTLGAVAYSFKGVLELDPALVGAALPTATVEIPRKGKPLPPPLILTFTINTAAAPANTANRLASASIGDGTPQNTIAFNAWRSIWAPKALPPVTPAEFAPNKDNAYYTLALLSPVPGAEDIPRGSGYVSFTVGADGRLTLAGRTADGQTITGAQFIGPQGQILVYQVLYKTKVKGSLLGNVSLTSAVPSELTDNKIAGTLEWNCPPNDAKTNFTYREGFGNATPVVVTAVGGHYAAPVDPNLVLGLQTGADNAVLTFENGGVEDSETNPDLDGPDIQRPQQGWVSVTTGNKLLTPAAEIANNGLVKISIVSKTGVFKGDFTLGDFPAGGIKPDVRKTPFIGVIVDEDDGTTAGRMWTGTGHFLLRQHPNDLPVTNPPTTLKTAPILSGQVIFEPR